MTSPRLLLIAAVGNGAHGPAQALVDGCRRIASTAQVSLGTVIDPQLRVEHALDLTHSDLAIIVTESDGAEMTGPITFQRLGLSTRHPIASAEDAVHPADIVHTLATLGRRDAMPACYALVLRSGAQDGDDAATAAAALDLLRELLEDPDPTHWDGKVEQPH